MNNGTLCMLFGLSPSECKKVMEGNYFNYEKAQDIKEEKEKLKMKEEQMCSDLTKEIANKLVNEYDFVLNDCLNKYKINVEDVATIMNISTDTLKGILLVAINQIKNEDDPNNSILNKDYDEDDNAYYLLEYVILLNKVNMLDNELSKKLYALATINTTNNLIQETSQYIGFDIEEIL